MYPEEVEECLKQNPSVSDCIVVGIADERFGARVAAVIALVPGSDATEVDALVKAHCDGVLAGYKMPRTVVAVGEILRGPNGKPDLKWAKALAEEKHAAQ